MPARRHSIIHSETDRSRGDGRLPFDRAKAGGLPDDRAPYAARPNQS
jgi:hypothetical protein